MHGIYFDNAATSFPKAPNVAESVADYLLHNGANINRGAYGSSYDAAQTVFETRELLCSLFNFNKPENVIFTRNITESLNLVMKGLLQENEHVLVSSFEHNAVMRPLSSLAKKGVSFSRVPCTAQGGLEAGIIREYIQPNTKAVIMTHASNVSGTVLPLAEVGAICQENNLIFIIDSAQTAGFLDLDFAKLHADVLTFTGHKSLLGPQGTGGLVLNDKIAELLAPFIEGGTGSSSEAETQPPYLPDKFESGTLNIPGIFGLNTAIKYLLKTGIESIRREELNLTDLFVEGISDLPKVKIIGNNARSERTALISLDFVDQDNAEIADMLARDFQIMTRCGLHCAPSAHKSLGTFPQGTVRFSFSHFNTAKEIEYALDSIGKCLRLLR